MNLLEKYNTEDNLFYFFVLIQKSNKKNQDKHEWLRPFCRANAR